jgi:hypothetical protein
MDRFQDDALFNSLILSLTQKGWITSSVEGNYGQIKIREEKLLEYLSKEELLTIMRAYKFSHYIMTNTQSDTIDRVKVNGVYKPTGLTRKGFMKAGNTRFSLETKILHKYLKRIADYELSNLTPSNKEVTYQEMIDLCMVYSGMEGEEYTLGSNTSDSRGRSIFSCTSKVFNPIGYKSARALLTCPEQPLTVYGYNAVCTAISVLLGFKTYTVESRIKAGESAYLNRYLPGVSEKDLWKLIWVERLYKGLDDMEHFNVPIELDSIASMIQIIGVLTNNRSFMEQTNLVDTGILQDIWSVEGLTREQVKKYLQPVLYGSGGDIEKLWEDIPHTEEQKSLMLQALYSTFSSGVDFKNFIMEKVKPTPKMKVKIWNDTFTIECNKFQWDKGEKKVYPVVTGNKVSSISREVFLTPDLEQFRRYFITLLIHNLDSQIADYVCQHMDWVLPNHDAFIIHPNDADYCSTLYCYKMYEMYEQRKDILSNYFKSIGIEEEFPEVSQEKVDYFNLTCLK